MIAYKFLRTGGVGPFSGFRWPLPNGEPGEWVDTDGDPHICERGVHGCSIDDLALWVDAELWRVELDDVLTADHGKLTARRGRLLERIEGWTGETALEFGAVCAQRVAERAETAARDAPGTPRAERLQAMAGDAAAYASGKAGDPQRPVALAATAAYVAAESAVHFDEDEYAAATERAWQGAWIAERLGLTQP